jgi:hypothetical protein
LFRHDDTPFSFDRNFTLRVTSRYGVGPFLTIKFKELGLFGSLWRCLRVYDPPERQTSRLAGGLFDYTRVSCGLFVPPDKAHAQTGTLLFVHFAKDIFSPE